MLCDALFGQQVLKILLKLLLLLGIQNLIYDVKHIFNI